MTIPHYYRIESNPYNGLVADKTQPGSFSSIAAIGMGLSVYVVAVDRGILSPSSARGCACSIGKAKLARLGGLSMWLLRTGAVRDRGAHRVDEDFHFATADVIH